MNEVSRSSFYHTEETKQAFVQDYFRTGLLTETCAVTKVPYETAKNWKSQDWFKESLAKLQQEANRLTELKLSKLIDDSFVEIEDRIKNGEERATKTGEVVRVKAGLAALTITAGTLFDKRQVLRKQETEKPTENDAIERLAEMLRKIASPEPKVIEAEDVEFKENNGT